MWQAHRAELHPKGLEIVTVALDTGGVEAAAPFIDAANAEHPSLIDQGHLLDELLGIVNVPSGVWIDENQVIVRPPEPAFPGPSILEKLDPEALPPDTDPYLVETLREARKIRHEPDKYIAALRDWVGRGEESAYALEPDEVLARSAPRGPETSAAAAHFELAQHLHTSGHPDDAIPHFREAHRLQPENWTYKRQAWSFLDPFQKPSEAYDSDWVSEIRKTGADNYYPALDM